MELKLTKFWQLYSVTILLSSIWYVIVQQQKQQAFGLTIPPSSNPGNTPSLSLAIILLSLAVILVLVSFFHARLGLFTFKRFLPQWLSISLSMVLAIFVVLFFSLFYRQAILGVSGRFLITLWAGGAAAFFMAASRSQFSAISAFFCFLVTVSFLYRIALFVPDMQSSPFSLGWSEGSRFYNASLYRAPLIYGEKFPLPVLHPARYLLQAIPFLFASQAIAVHRVWQVILWLGLTLLGAFTLQRRLQLPNSWMSFFLTLWLFSYFFQGAVYYHLMVCVILVMWGYKRSSFWRTMIAVLIASIWAGLCRVNWYPVPGLLAAALYFIENPVSDSDWKNYLKAPVIWAVVGTSMAFLSNHLYALISGNDTAQFLSSFSSYLIWSRLLPNNTFNLGIIIAILLVTLPLFLAAWSRIQSNGWRTYWQWPRVFGLAGILAVFALGGVLVSVKVGGGGDLHNLDAFLVFMVLISGMLIFDRYAQGTDLPKKPYQMPGILLIMLLLVPVYFSMRPQNTWRFKSIPQEQKQLVFLQNALTAIAEEKSAPILFISERQLVTFGNLRGFKIEPDYEKVFLMEMVMSHNEVYLQEFHEKLQMHQYAAIVSDSLFTKTAGKSDEFWVENNLWIDKVVYPLLEQYESVLSLQDGGVNLLVPRDNVDLFNKVRKANP